MAKTKREKQGHLPGLEPPRHKDLDRLADDYVAVRDERMRLTQTEADKQTLLHEMMKKHGLRSYEFDGKVIEIVAGEEKVKVRKKKESVVEAGKRHLSNGKADE